jgi:hypothetical protein
MSNHAPAFRLPARLVAALFMLATAVHGQVIQIKTLPIADGDQWRFFPSANAGMAGVSIALPDSLLDPFVNPALGSRVSAGSRGIFFGSPAFYSVSKNAGGGQSFPAGGIIRHGSTFGGFALVLQEVDHPNVTSGGFFPPVPLAAGTNTSVAPPITQTPSTPSRQNRYAFASLGHVIAASKLSFAASVLWSGLRNVDGVDLLYAGSQAINQHGDALDARLGLSKEWAGSQNFEAILVRNRFGMTHDVTWSDLFFDPNTRSTVSMPRLEHNIDRTDTWGLQLQYSRPLADSGWRIGGVVTSNLMSHPKLPDYQITQVMVIPWDPGHSAAYNFGVGVSKSHGATTLGVDAIYEPIRTHTWGESPSAVETPSGGTVPAGGKTTENFFNFSNAILRAGVGHELELSKDQHLAFQMGLALRSISYQLNQTDHVAETRRRQDESWTEWTRTWGLSMRFSDLEVRYTGKLASGTGRPGVRNDGVIFAAADVAAPGANVISAPNGPLTLTGVAVTTHQLSVSLPIR